MYSNSYLWLHYLDVNQQWRDVYHYILLYDPFFQNRLLFRSVSFDTIYKNLSFVWFAWHTYSFPVLPVQWKLLWSHYILYLHFTANNSQGSHLNVCVYVSKKKIRRRGYSLRTTKLLFQAKMLPPITVYSTHTHKRIFFCYILLLPSVENTFLL